MYVISRGIPITVKKDGNSYYYEKDGRRVKTKLEVHKGRKPSVRKSKRKSKKSKKKSKRKRKSKKSKKKSKRKRKSKKSKKKSKRKSSPPKKKKTSRSLAKKKKTSRSPPKKKKTSRSPPKKKSKLPKNEYLIHFNGTEPFKIVKKNSKTIEIYSSYMYDYPSIFDKHVKTYNNVKTLYFGDHEHTILAELDNGTFVFIGNGVYEFKIPDLPKNSRPDFESFIANNDVPESIIRTDKYYYLLEERTRVKVEGFEDFDSGDIYEVFYYQKYMPDYSSKMKVKVIAEMRNKK